MVLNIVASTLFQRHQNLILIFAPNSEYHYEFIAIQNLNPATFTNKVSNTIKANNHTLT
jgi:hypothetical protein